MITSESMFTFKYTNKAGETNTYRGRIVEDDRNTNATHCTIELVERNGVAMDGFRSFIRANILRVQENGKFASRDTVGL